MIHVSRVQTTPVSRVQTIGISRVQTNPRPQKKDDKDTKRKTSRRKARGSSEKGKGKTKKKQEEKKKRSRTPTSSSSSTQWIRVPKKKKHKKHHWDVHHPFGTQCVVDIPLSGVQTVLFWYGSVPTRMYKVAFFCMTNPAKRHTTIWLRALKHRWGKKCFLGRWGWHEANETISNEISSVKIIAPSDNFAKLVLCFNSHSQGK